MRRGLLFLPSLALGVAGGVVLLLRPLPYPVRISVPWQLAAGVATGALLLAAAWVLERTVPSFRYASRLLEDVLRSAGIAPWMALLLAAATAAAEEAFFRGALLPWVGLPAQAVLFGLMHVAPRRAWAYPAFAVAAGLAFGVLTRETGSLLPAMVAHFGVNLQGLWEVRRPGSAALSEARAPDDVRAPDEARAPDDARDRPEPGAE